MGDGGCNKEILYQPFGSVWLSTQLDTIVESNCLGFTTEKVIKHREQVTFKKGRNKKLVKSEIKYNHIKREQEFTKPIQKHVPISTVTHLTRYNGCSNILETSNLIVWQQETL